MFKVLITYANAGAGHRKAAEAVFDAIKRDGRNADARIIDALDYTNGIFRRSYPSTYLFLVNKVPHLWALCFYLLDYRPLGFIIRPLRRVLNKINSFKLEQFLIKEKFDILISTHFMPTEVTARLKMRGLVDTKLINVVTDYGVHAFWINKGADVYIVATEATKRELAAKGVDEKSIVVLGIPINPVFSIKKDRGALLSNIGIKDGYFNVLIGSGGFGVGPVREIVRNLGMLGGKLQILAVCGNNKKLYEDITGFARSSKAPVKAFGFVNNMDELMEVSDLIITKSGGLTTSEALSKRLPMIILSPIPGQESNNSRLLVESGAAIRVDNAGEAGRAVVKIMNNNETLIKMKESISRIARPDSARDIAKLAFDMTGDGR